MSYKNLFILYKILQIIHILHIYLINIHTISYALINDELSKYIMLCHTSKHILRIMEFIPLSNNS